MKFSTFLASWRTGRLPLLLRLDRLLHPFYRVTFLATASVCGLLRRLSGGPVSFEGIAAELAPAPRDREALEAWLHLGVQLKELGLEPQGYVLRGKLARQLADPAHDGAAAFLEEAASLHHTLLSRTPEFLRQGRRFTLADQDGELIARSSRIMEPLVQDAIDLALPSGPCRLLEIGCGSGTYILYAAVRNPRLTALGVELQPEVAAMARDNLSKWGLAARAEVVAGDIRSRGPEPVFDLATLHNNIYYFPRESRPGLLAHVRGFLKPVGRLLLTTGCRGGGLVMSILDLWGAATEGCGPLPDPEEMQEQLRQAGFTQVVAKKLYPFDSYYAFFGVNPG